MKDNKTEIRIAKAKRRIKIADTSAAFVAFVIGLVTWFEVCS